MTLKPRKRKNWLSGKKAEEDKMKLKKLVLQNIGAFLNRNEINFECNLPIILIGGLNGRGKTTILESVLVALYGKRSGNLIGNHQKFEEYLYKISNKNGESVECFIELSFQVNADKELWEYRVRRYWDRERSRLKMYTDVWKNGNKDKALSESWDMFIEEILPQAVAPFFFFDGEKISELASEENEEQISDSIKALLGVDVIERLIRDLHVIESNKVKEIRKNKFAVELEEQERQLEVIKEQIQFTKEQLEEQKKENICLENELEILEQQYTAAGGYYAVQRKNIEKEYEQTVEKKQEIDNKLLEKAAGDLPLKMVRGLLEDVSVQTTREQEQKEVQILLNKVPELYREYKKTKEISDIDAFISFIGSKLETEPIIYDIDDESGFRLKNIEKVFCREAAETNRLLSEKKRLNQRIDELENYLLIKVDVEAINVIFEEIKNKTALKAIHSEKIVVLEKSLEDLNESLIKLEKGRTRTLENMVKSLENEDEAKRIVKYVEQQTQILQAYKLELQSLKVDRLSKKMSECFKRLITKEGLIENICIDSKTLKFSYYDNQGLEVDKMILSAGEKQLLVIAMLWALGICANTEFPLIIDTPLARLDSNHRASLINNYFPYASEQVIILSTDQEIGVSDYALLKPNIGKEYILQYHENTMSSTVEEGYFGGLAK